MTNANKVKGDRAERAAREALRALGFPWCEKTRAGYERDLGDLHLGPGVIAQVKDWGRPDWTLWLRGLHQQMANAAADHGFLLVKRRGIGEPRAGEWLAVMTVEQMALLLRRAGYGSDLPSDSESNEINTAVQPATPATT